VPFGVDDVAKVDGITTMLAQPTILFYLAACVAVHPAFATTG
jgi:hypothetical protein